MPRLSVALTPDQWGMHRSYAVRKHEPGSKGDRVRRAWGLSSESAGTTHRVRP